MKNKQICLQCGNIIHKNPVVWQKQRDSSSLNIEKYSVYDSGTINSCDYCKALLYNKNRKKFERTILWILVLPVLAILFTGIFYSLVISLIAFAILILLLLLFNTIIAPKIFYKITNESDVQSYILIDSNHKEIKLKSTLKAQINMIAKHQKEYVTDNVIQIKGIKQDCYIMLRQIVSDCIAEFSYISKEKNNLKTLLSKDKEYELSNGEETIGTLTILEFYE